MIGTSHMSHVPAVSAAPSAVTTMPRYIGLRVKRKGPLPTSVLCCSDHGKMSAPLLLNVSRPQAANATPSTMSAMPVGRCWSSAGALTARSTSSARITSVISQIGVGIRTIQDGLSVSLIGEAPRAPRSTLHVSLYVYIISSGDRQQYGQ